MTERIDQTASSDPQEFLRPLWRHRFLIAIVVAVATVATYEYESRKPPQYETSTQIYVQASEVDQSLVNLDGGELDPDRNLQNQATLLQTLPVAEAVAKIIGFKGDPQALLGGISATPASGSDFLTITSEAGSGAAAAQLANAFAQAFINERTTATQGEVAQALTTTKQQLARLPNLESTSGSRATLQQEITSLEGLQALASGGATQTNQAPVPGVPFAPRPRRAALFGFVLSLVFSIMIAFGLERLGRRIKHLDDVSPAYGATLLAALPHLPGGVLARRSDAAPQLTAPFQEAIRGLRTTLRLASPDSPLRSILITSAVPGEGKSTVAFSLALSFVESGFRVALLECDLRLPTLARIAAVPAAPGLADVLAGECQLHEAVQAVEAPTTAAPVAVTAVGRRATDGWSREPSALTMLTAGTRPPDPSSLLAGDGMKRVLDSALEHADVVVIDTPPLLSAADALPLLGLVDATILIARVGTRRVAGRRVRETIAAVPGASMFGVVANDLPENELAGEEYGYGYGYGYGRTPAEST